jgi:hypothetical protein
MISWTYLTLVCSLVVVGGKPKQIKKKLSNMYRRTYDTDKAFSILNAGLDVKKILGSLIGT